MARGLTSSALALSRRPELKRNDVPGTLPAIAAQVVFDPSKTPHPIIRAGLVVPAIYRGKVFEYMTATKAAMTGIAAYGEVNVSVGWY